MSDVDHCPFLNRSDSRCAEHFSLDHLQHAFKFCFDRYAACPVYAEMLAERQIRRSQASAGLAAVGLGARGMKHARQTLVSITIPARHAQPQPNASAVPAASCV